MTGRERVPPAAPRGFHAGVVRAVQAVERALDIYGPPVDVRHEIVHHTHDVAPVVHEEAAVRQLTAIDATCPLVIKVRLSQTTLSVDEMLETVEVARAACPPKSTSTSRCPGNCPPP